LGLSIQAKTTSLVPRLKATSPRPKHKPVLDKKHGNVKSSTLHVRCGQTWGIHVNRFNEKWGQSEQRLTSSFTLGRLMDTRSPWLDEAS
jgi:hypothetical protein